MCKKDDEALRLLREVVTDSPGRPEEEEEENSSNRTNNPTRGTTKDYTLDRLARESPESYGMEPLPYPTNPASVRIEPIRLHYRSL